MNQSGGVSFFQGFVGAVSRVVVEGLGDLLGPRDCSACDAPLPAASVFCTGCASTVERDEEGSVAPFLFEGALRDAILRLKYQRRSDLGAPLGELLRSGAPRVQGVDLVVPVPLHPSKLVERGYNQAALLARGIARDLRAPLATSALVRHRVTAAQATLDRDHREQNVRGAFVARASRVEGRYVLLVDDVYTTGATLMACEVALKEAGARSVAQLALARRP